MTAIEKVLLRRDISSIVVAIVVGLATLSFLAAVTTPLAETLLNMGEENFLGEDPGFTAKYALPTLIFVLQVAALELLLRIVIAARHNTYGKTRISSRKK